MSKGAAQPSKVDLDRFNLCESFDSFQELMVFQADQLNNESDNNKFSKPYVRSMMHITTRLCIEMMKVFAPAGEPGSNAVPAELESLKQKLSDCDIFTGELGNVCISRISNFKPDKKPDSLMLAIIQKHVSSDAVLATVLSAVCEYIIFELKELGYQNLRDTRGVLERLVLISDCKLLKDLVSSSASEATGIGKEPRQEGQEEEEEGEEEEDISIIRARYVSSSIPFLCISSAAEQDEEVKALFKRLGIEFLCSEEECPGPVPKEEEEEEEEEVEEEDQSKQVKYAKVRPRKARVQEMRKEKIAKYGLGFGLSLFDEPSPDPITLSAFKYFCTKYPCVDEKCRTSDEEGDINRNAEEMLEKVRLHTNGRLVLDWFELSRLDALPSLQILGAVLFHLQESVDTTVILKDLGDCDDGDINIAGTIYP